jgi:hypothetical protein
MAPYWIGRHIETINKKIFMDHLRIFPKCIQFLKLVENCKIHILKKVNYTIWRYFGLAAILKYQLSKIHTSSQGISKNVFNYLNGLENAKTTSHLDWPPF